MSRPTVAQIQALSSETATLRDQLAAAQADVAALQTSRRLWREALTTVQGRLRHDYVVRLPSDPLPLHLLDPSEVEEHERAAREQERRRQAEIEDRHRASREWCDEMNELLGN